MRCAALAALLASGPAWAVETLEMDAAAGGPAGPGDVTTDQTVTFRRNTDNPGGSSFAAMSNPLTATFRLSNQRYPGVGSQSTFGGSGFDPYAAMDTLAGPDSQLTSTGVGAATGVGIDASSNGAIYMFQRVAGPLAQGAPPNGRIPMVDLTITFNRPVDNPVLHVIGLGGNQSLKSFTTELSLTSPGSLALLSGSSNLSVVGNQINNNAVLPVGGDCAGGLTGCGSVRVNGTGLTSVAFTLFLRGDGLDPWEADGGDLLAIGLSVDQPPQLTVRALSYGTTGNFSYSGTNGFASQNIVTVTPGTPLAAPTQVLALGSPTVVTQNIVAGPPLTGIACTNPATGAAVPGAVVNLATGEVTLDNDAVESGAQVQCTFTYGTPPAVAPIPTLGQWGVVLLGLLLAATGVPMLRRR